MVKRDEIPVLSIGVVVGGTSDNTSRWEAGIGNLAKQVIQSRSGFSSPLKLNVVFHVPGHLIAPDYEGMRTGRYSKKEATLMVQIAVPREPPMDVEDYLLKALSGALDVAEEWASQRRMPQDLHSLRQLVSSLR